MKIATTAFATDAGRSGLSVYLRELTSALLREPQVERITVYGPPGIVAHLPDGPGDLRVVELPPLLDRRATNVLWHQTGLLACLLRDRPDVVHFPVANRRAAVIPFIPTVGTVHDLGDLAVANKYGRGRELYLTHVVPRVLRGLDRLIAISGSTRDDLRATLRTCPPIDVVHNGIDHGRFRVVPQAEAWRRLRTTLDLPAPYVFYAARLEHPAKNHARLIRAFVAARSRGVPHRLVLAGAEWPGAGPVLELMERHREHVVWLGFVDAAQLPLLYAGADMTVFPSLYEGFGLPVLESMACGTPVLASNASSIPEVAGGAAALVDATDEVALTDAIVALLGDERRRATMRAWGLERAAAHSWQATARLTLASFEAARRESQRP